MEFDSNNTKYIEAYLNNELTEDEQKTFEKRIADDPDLRKEVELHRELRTAFQEHGKQQLKKRLEDFYAQHKQKREQRRKIKILAPIASAAAVITVLIAIIVPDHSTKDPNQETITLDSAQIQEGPEYADSATYKRDADTLMTPGNKNVE